MKDDRLKAVMGTFTHPLLIHLAHHEGRFFDFTLKGKKKNWNTRFFFNDLFPYSLPSVFLLEKDLIGTIPHVDASGILCIDVSDSIIIDYKQPEQLISAIINSAVEMLEFGSLKINRIELLDELEGFSEKLSSRIPGNIIGEDLPQKLYLKLWRPSNGRQTDGEPFFIQGEGQGLPDKYSNFSKTSAFQTIKSIYISTEYSILPPQGGKSPDAAYIYEIFSLVENKFLKRVDKIISKFSAAREHYILFGLPRSQGVRSLMLFRMTAPKPTPHPLKEKSSDWDIKTYLINRHDKGYLLERGGANSKLLNSSVTLIGCGSVGSEISVMLAKAGVGHLTLIDDDFLETDNIYRHRLGGSYISYEPGNKRGKILKWRKTDALVNFLEKELPHIKVNAISSRAENMLFKEELSSADLVISAVGSPALNLYLNKEFKSLNYKKIIYCWNEAASAGGHALSVHLDSSCYECQFCRSGAFSLESSINLVMAGQHLTKNLTGCGGVFTPFSYLDSSQTAMLATRLCIESLEKESVNKLVSWKNPNVSGVKLTERYHEMAIIEETAYSKSCSCEVCNNG